MQDKHYLVPIHKHATETDFEYSVVCKTIDDAEELFVIAKNRLLDVNHWHTQRLAGAFQLTNDNEKLVNRSAHKGDHIRVDVQAPGSEARVAYEWVHIDAIEYDDYPDQDMETFAMRVRSSLSPLDDKNIGAVPGAAGVFIVERHGKKLTSLYHGRNIQSNASGTENTMVNAEERSWLGLSHDQWCTLIRRLVQC